MKPNLNAGATVSAWNEGGREEDRLVNFNLIQHTTNIHTNYNYDYNYDYNYNILSPTTTTTTTTSTYYQL